PLRYSQFETPERWFRMGFSEASAVDYLSAIQSSIEHPNAVLDLRVPGAFEYLDALDTAISHALSGELDAQTALNNAAAAWDAITDQRGRDAQLAAYQASLPLRIPR